MTAAPELLPCPFCGGPAETRFWEWPYERYHVRCRKCHASAGGRLSFLSNAVEQWNTRTALARAPAPELIRQAVEAERERADRQEAAKDAAYLERNKLVALMASIYPAGIKRTAIEGWSEDWHGCVYIDLPFGQASWHYHDSQAWLFDHLPLYAGEWDGHTTEEKYDRIVAYAIRAGE